VVVVPVPVGGRTGSVEARPAKVVAMAKKVVENFIAVKGGFGKLWCAGLWGRSRLGEVLGFFFWKVVVSSSALDCLGDGVGRAAFI